MLMLLLLTFCKKASLPVAIRIMQYDKAHIDAAQDLIINALLFAMASRGIPAPSTSSANDDTKLAVWRVSAGFQTADEDRAYNEASLNKILSKHLQDWRLNVSKDGSLAWADRSSHKPIDLPHHPSSLLLKVRHRNRANGEVKRYILPSTLTVDSHGFVDLEASRDQFAFGVKPVKIRRPSALERLLPGGSAAISLGGLSVNSTARKDGSSTMHGWLTIHEGDIGSQSLAIMSRFDAGTITAKVPWLPDSVVDFDVVGTFEATIPESQGLYQDLVSVAFTHRPFGLFRREDLGLASEADQWRTGRTGRG
jgi:hypothetical protein